MNNNWHWETKETENQTWKNTVGVQTFYSVFFFPAFSLSLQPFEHPLCTKDGVIFDLL